MGDDLTDKLTEHGRVASHPERPVSPLLVAPTTTTEFNTLSLPLPAVACIQMADVLFEFDSSFVLHDAAIILKDLPVLRSAKANKQGDLPPLGVFGHADPVGDDEYNKKLSGRRAAAIYALLIRDASLWEGLYSSPAGGDRWGNPELAAMLATVGCPADDGGQIQPAVSAFQSKNGLPPTGHADAGTR